jgi:hypothetical protein
MRSGTLGPTIGTVEIDGGWPTWPAFIRIHLALLAGTDFLTVEVLTLRGW